MNHTKTALLAVVTVAAASIVMAALPQKINLRERDKLISELAEKEKTAGKAWQRAVAGYDRRRLEMLICEEKDFAAKEKALEDYIQNPGLAAGDYVYFLIENVANDYPLRRAEFLQMADKQAMASTNKLHHLEFYKAVVKKLADGPWSWREVEVPELSNDALLKYVERAEKDPLMEDKNLVAGWKADSLCALCRYEEAEALLRKMLESADDKAKPMFAEKLAKFYDARSYRFYSTPDPALKRKAVDMYEYKCSLAKNGDPKSRSAIIELLIGLGDWKKARSWIDVDVAAQKEQKPSGNDMLWYGDVAFGEGNWAEASKWYSQYSGNQNNWLQLHKMAKAHHAAGNDELAYGALTNALKKCNNRYERPHLEFEIENIRKAIGVNGK